MALLTMTMIAAALAGATSVMAWRLARREARRSDARVALLAAAIFEDERPFGDEMLAVTGFPSEYAEEDDPAPPPAGTDSHRTLAMLSTATLIVGAVALVASARQLTADPHSLRTASVQASEPSRPAPDPAAAGRPLELVALGHERVKNGLVVRGIIRNPSDGARCAMPVAVVLSFDDHGIFLGSSESDATGDSLVPGGQAAFTVHITAKTAPARYKVSFRNEGRVVPHIDKRERGEQTTGVGSGSPTSRQERVPS